VYDGYERRSGLVRLLDPEVTPEDWAMARATDLGDLVDGPYSLLELGPGRVIARRQTTVLGARIDVTKSIILGGNRRRQTLDLTIEFEHREGPTVELRCGIEWTLTMLGGGGNPSAWWDVAGRRTAHDVAGSATAIRSVAQGNDHIGIAVTTTLDEPADGWWAPVETVSNSENGFERAYQGAGLLVSWVVRLDAGERVARTVHQTVTTGRDRA